MIVRYEFCIFFVDYHVTCLYFICLWIIINDMVI